MSLEVTLLAFTCFMFIAMLYSSIGHAGASGYLAIMALLSFESQTIKPISLILNIIVASIASIKFIRKGYFDKKIFFTFILISFPMAFVGGYISLSAKYFKIFVGFFLIISAIWIIIKHNYIKLPKYNSAMPKYLGIILGGLIGLISGLIGVGGGVFLSPILILNNWTTLKKASGISALYILFNSIAGLLGHYSSIFTIDFSIIQWIIAVVIGGLIGSSLGTNSFSNKIIIFCLFVVLLLAGLKFLFMDV